VDIRKQWKELTLPFYLVLLAAGHTAEFREIQILPAYQLPYTFFSNALDLGDPNTTVPGHPRRKQEVGRRLSLIAQNLMYKQQVEYHGPTLFKVSNISRISDTQITCTILFNYTLGLHLNGTAACTSCCNPTHSPFKFFDPNTNFTVFANVTNLNANTGQVVITGSWNTTQSKLFQLYFLFEDTPQCGLYNGVGGADDHSALVGEPFRVNVTL